MPESEELTVDGDARAERKDSVKVWTHGNRIWVKDVVVVAKAQARVHSRVWVARITVMSDSYLAFRGRFGGCDNDRQQACEYDAANRQ